MDDMAEARRHLEMTASEARVAQEELARELASSKKGSVETRDAASRTTCSLSAEVVQSTTYQISLP